MKAGERSKEGNIDDGEEEINGNNEGINSENIKMCVKTSTRMLVSKVK